ncbi:MAG: hypothetical protein J3K34DRAFT_418189 [Monoraphidium minutum]|nr:MAG: hypothetical protein J3K34DRAFT_418189 [Monoraphidium minutum]
MAGRLLGRNGSRGRQRRAGAAGAAPVGARRRIPAGTATVGRRARSARPPSGRQSQPRCARCARALMQAGGRSGAAAGAWARVSSAGLADRGPKQGGAAGDVPANSKRGCQPSGRCPHARCVSSVGCCVRGRAPQCGWAAALRRQGRDCRQVSRFQGLVRKRP